MLPILLTEDDKGEFRIDSNPIASDDNSLAIMIEHEAQNDTDERASNISFEMEARRHHAIYEGWTRMTPQEISRWIDKYKNCLITVIFLILF